MDLELYKIEDGISNILGVSIHVDVEESSDEMEIVDTDKLWSEVVPYLDIKQSALKAPEFQVEYEGNAIASIIVSVRGVPVYEFWRE